MTGIENKKLSSPSGAHQTHTKPPKNKAIPQRESWADLREREDREMKSYETNDFLAVLGNLDIVLNGNKGFGDSKKDIGMTSATSDELKLLMGKYERTPAGVWQPVKMALKVMFYNFPLFDLNGDGKITSDELITLSNRDGNAKNISYLDRQSQSKGEYFNIPK